MQQLDYNELRDRMLPIGIEIELSASFADSDLEDLISNHQIIYQRDFCARKYRKKAQSNIQQFLGSRVPGRQKQIEQISKFICNLKLGDKTPLCLHGSTGCGKTSVIMQTLNYLQNNDEDFQTMYINCLSFTSIKKIYSTILQYFFQQKDKKPEQILTNLFTHTQNSLSSLKTKLIVFDEIDQCSNNKAFMYNILEWVQAATSPLGIIMISNMADFSSKLQNKAKSRIKYNSIIFAPYNYQDLIEIVKYKYQSTNQHFQKDAIVYLCKKIASINSDVRLLERYYLDALKYSGNLGKSNNRKKIDIQNIQKLFTPPQKGIHQILKPYMFILQILWRCPKLKNISIDIQHYCLANGIKKYSDSQFVCMLSDLQQMGLIKINKDRKVCDFYYELWGIDLLESAYSIQATRVVA